MCTLLMHTETYFEIPIHSYFQTPIQSYTHSSNTLIYCMYSAQRTHVLDDERDFFAVDATSWASAEEKAALEKRERELRELKYGSRRNKAFTLDIAGKKVVEESSKIGESLMKTFLMTVKIYYPNILCLLQPFV